MFDQFVQTIIKRKRLILAVAFLTMVSVFFGTYLTEPTYDATARILVQAPVGQLASSEQTTSAKIAMVSGVGPVTMNTIGILQSDTVSDQVIRDVKLDEYLRDKAAKPSTRGRVKRFISSVIRSPLLMLQAFGVLDRPKPNYFTEAKEYMAQDLLDVQPTEGSDLINITIHGPNPELSSAIANAAVTNLMATTRSISKSRAQEALDAARKGMTAAQERLTETETQLADFKSANDGAWSENRESQLEKLATVEFGLIETESSIKGTKSELREVEKQLGGVSQTIELPSSRNESTSEERGTADAPAEQVLSESSESSAVSSSLNPTYQELKVRQVDLAASLEGLTATKSSLESQQESLQDGLGPLSVVENQLVELERDHSAADDFYAGLRDTAFEFEFMASNPLSALDVQTIDQANLPKDSKPDSPSWPTAIVLGAFASLVFGAGAAFGLEYWSNAYRLPDEVESDLQLKVLASVPDLNGTGNGGEASQAELPTPIDRFSDEHH